MNNGTVLKNKYKILNKIGNGKFGVVYKASDKKNIIYAVKTENTLAPIRLLKNETTILKYLYDRGCREIPIVFWYGIYENMTCLIMSYYDISLHDYCMNNSLTVEKVNSIIIAAVNILESIHKEYVIHRDIKPHNFMMRNNELFLIDFGFATFYIDENKEHLENMGSHNSILGTPKYVSYNIHLGHSPSRRDDLISLFYMYFFLCYRELPWDNLKLDNNDQNYEEIHILHYKNQQRKHLKSYEQFNEVCSRINQKLSTVLSYCYHLKYEDCINYDALRSVFKN
jgi:serine/threonine protein kinase